MGIIQDTFLQLQQFTVDIKNKTKIGDIRRWHPARNPDGRTLNSENEQQAVIDISKNRNFTLTDYVWFNSSAHFSTENTPTPTEAVRNIKNIDIPKVILKEFQPDFLFNWGKIIEESIGSAIKGSSSSSGTSTEGAGANATNGFVASTARLFGRFAGVAGAGVKAGVINKSLDHMNGMMRKIARSPAEFDNNVISSPVAQIRRMFEGEYLGTYELPYYGDDYISASSIDSWNREGLGAHIGSKMGTILKENMSFDVPTTPTWKNENGGGMPPPIEIDLILYNKNTKALIDNFRFIHALISGAYWAQLNFNQKSPNLYDVTIPGRLHYWYCAMDIELQYLGKSRALSKEAGSEFKTAFGNININTIAQNSAGKTTEERGDNYMFPDGYQVKVKLQSLMPNNFNMYLDYLLNGSTEKGEISRELVEQLQDVVISGVRQGLPSFLGGGITSAVESFK
jgi:hypothetical protein